MSRNVTTSHRIRIAAGAIGAAMLIASCGQGGAIDGETQEIHSWGTAPAFEPFSYKEDGEFTGFEHDLLQAIAKAGGFEVKFVESPQFEGLIPGLQSGRYDGAYGGLVDDAGRHSKFDLVSWAQGQSEFLTLKDNLSQLKEPSDLCGRKAAVVQGSEVHAGFVRLYSKEFCGDENAIEQVEMAGDTSTAVRSGRADVMYSSTFVRRSTLKKLPDFARFAEPFGPKASIGMLLPNGNEELKKKVLRGLEAIREDGTYEKIMAKWGQEDSLADGITINGVAAEK